MNAHGTVPAGAGSSRRRGSSSCPCRDHPRRRGEQLTSPVSSGLVAGPSPQAREQVLLAWPAGKSEGPSPQARGAARRRSAVSAAAGTIPAGAGSSGLPLLPLIGCGDHPRRRGEQGSSVRLSAPCVGPPPQARGAVQVPAFRHPHGGTIPAGAGSSPRSGTRGWRWRDHPRRRGEQLGSAVQRVELGGTIPAGAGSSATRPRGRAGSGDHPRRRGEQCERSWLLRNGDGTIPAGAGSSRRRSGPRLRQRDHPRRRGEQIDVNGAPVVGPGPSPQARGAAARDRAHPVRPGTIPAGAGSSWRAGTPPPSGRDHPRRRGEQVSTGTESPAALGPSPQARGAATLAGSCTPRRRTIPAGAGSSLVDLRCYVSVGRKSASFKDSDISDIEPLPFLSGLVVLRYVDEARLRSCLVVYREADVCHGGGRSLWVVLWKYQGARWCGRMFPRPFDTTAASPGTDTGTENHPKAARTAA